jgi:HAD superfamily hydrolase (TIGR01509 family)
MLRWIFFDVGNVLLDEDPLTYRNFCLHVDAVRQTRPDRTFYDLLAESEARAAAGDRWPLASVVAQYLGEAEHAAVWEASERAIRAEFAVLSPPVPGALAAIERLGRHYHLGLIANQGAECRAHLAALGWLERFEVVAFSEERGHFKPDAGLFRDALGQAGAAPEESLIVGDRVDNDIAPAAALGMATAWVRWPVRRAKGWPTGDDREALAYLASLERGATRASALHPHVHPTIVGDTLIALEKRLRVLPESDCGVIPGEDSEPALPNHPRPASSHRRAPKRHRRASS